jgi:hypothetical protein
MMADVMIYSVIKNHREYVKQGGIIAGCNEFQAVWTRQQPRSTRSHAIEIIPLPERSYVLRMMNFGLVVMIELHG